MTIKEIEQLTRLNRSVIRFYEKEKLICPKRNDNNGYREYSNEDLMNIKKIAYLRTLRISIEDIRALSNKDASLSEVIKKQSLTLDNQISELKSAKMMCEKMLSTGEMVNYEDLEIEQYITNLEAYWNDNQSIFKLDTVSFFYMWSGNITWITLTIACLIAAVFSIGDLPPQIPVQWSGGIASLLVDKRFIFAFPAACVIIKFALRPFVLRWLKMNNLDTVDVTNYITNFLCFIALSVEVFIILYVNGIVKHVTILLWADTFVLIGLLILACHKLIKKNQ